jgi:hypothetical protein
MKINIGRRIKKAASALLTALFICSIFSLFVVYYLSLIEQQNVLNSRSQTWNMAITIAEAGIEEGMEHLNVNNSNLGIAPWSSLGGNVYYRSNTMPGGSGYVVYITNSVNPIILARATVQVSTFLTAARNLSEGFFAAAGVSTAPATVIRAVQVTCAKANPFTAAVVVKNNIDLKGNGVYTDSFNSSDPTKSTNGQYDSSKYSGDKGDIATNGGITNSVNVQNGNIYGCLHTGANCPVSIGPNGAVGTHAWQASNSGIEPGYVLQDANFTFPDTSFPNTSSFLTPTGGVLVVWSNYATSFSTNVALYPVPAPVGGVTTNTTPVTVNNWLLVPSPTPAGTTTNTGATATVSLWALVPLPTPPGTTTNTSSTTTATYPIAGTYVGPVTTNTHAHSITGYTYELVSGYTYPTPTYTYPTYSYTFSLYTTNSVSVTNHYDNLLWGNTSGTNYYVSTALTGQSIVLGPNVVLALPNGMTGAENLTISPAGNILIFSGGTSFSAAGNQIVNPNGYAGSFVVYCAPTVTSFSLAGNGQFTGLLVAPYADVALKGGGNNNQDFSGMLMANSLTLNGHFSFHYDEALLGGSSFGRYLITSWNEVP